MYTCECADLPRQENLLQVCQSVVDEDLCGQHLHAIGAEVEHLRVRVKLVGHCTEPSVDTLGRLLAALPLALAALGTAGR